MLLLRRRVGESIVIGEGVRITVTEVRGGTVRIAIDAPHDMPVHRAELLESLGPENERALLRRSMPAPSAVSATDRGAPSEPAYGLTDPTITVPAGILGLGGHTEFLLYDVDDTLRMLVAKHDPTLRLLLADPMLVDSRFPLARAVSRFPFGDEDVAVACVVTRPADGSPATANLVAPLLIGMSSQKAVQVILDDDRLSLRTQLSPSAPEVVVSV